MAKLIDLPDDFIGKSDEKRLESFGAYLISHGRATRWHWNRRRGIDVAFEVYSGGAQERFLFRFQRDSAHDAFTLTDGDEGVIAEGPLDHLMAVAFERTASGPNDSA
jgi:hypothetical protein